MARPSFLPSPTVIAFALACGLLPAGGGALAQALCSEPVEPICATRIAADEPNGATDREVARRRCIDDAKTYREKLAEYRQCLESSLQEASAGVEAAGRFIRCLEDGDADCRLQVGR